MKCGVRIADVDMSALSKKAKFPIQFKFTCVCGEYQEQEFFQMTARCGKIGVISFPDVHA